MEARINYHVRDIFMLTETPIPSALNKHLTNKIFNKPNKDAMEQVLYYLLRLTNKNCLSTLPWPIHSLKEAAEFRNGATVIINGLNGFVYEKSSNAVKVNSSLLANPGGPMFVFFMYQFCLFIKCFLLKKKGISILNAPLYIEDEYIEKKILMFAEVSKCNFNEVIETISRVDKAFINTECIVKWKDIIQDTKQRIKDLKSELKSSEHCEVTEKEVAELKKVCTDLYNNFEQNKLIAIHCAKLGEIILKTPEFLDAIMIKSIFNVNKEELIGNNKELDFLKLLTNIKNTLNNNIDWCEKLNDDGEINDKVIEFKQSIIVMEEQMQCYENFVKFQKNLINNLQMANQELNEDIFTCKSLENIDPRLKFVYSEIFSIVINTDFNDKPKLMTSEYNRKSRRSFLLPCNNISISYKTISVDTFKDVLRTTLPSDNSVEVEDVIYENASSLHECKPITQIKLPSSNEHLQDKTRAFFNNELPSSVTVNDKMNNVRYITKEEEEVKSVSISRKSIENMKQKLSRIKKQAQAMSTIPHSPKSPF